MTTISDEPAAVGPEPQATTPGDRDPLLGIIINAIDHHPGFEIGVTLHVQGLVVCGVIIAASSYFGEVAEMIRHAGPAGTAPDREGLADVFAWISDEMRPVTGVEAGEAEAGEVEESDFGGLPHFMHMRDARVWAPGGGSEMPGTLWRGRLDQVSGWSIGTFGRAQ
jgi:hypothetical protein